MVTQDLKMEGGGAREGAQGGVDEDEEKPAERSMEITEKRRKFEEADKPKAS